MKQILITYREKVLGIVEVDDNETDGGIEKKIKDWTDDHIEWEVME